MKSNHLIVSVLLASSVFFRTSECRASYALFSSSTDTISVAGDTTLSGATTYEATVLLTSVPSATGHIFNEWRDGLEDKDLLLDPGSVLEGFTYGLTPGKLTTPVTLS